MIVSICPLGYIVSITFNNQLHKCLLLILHYDFLPHMPLTLSVTHGQCWVQDQRDDFHEAPCSPGTHRFRRWTIQGRVGCKVVSNQFCWWRAGSPRVRFNKLRRSASGGWEGGRNGAELVPIERTS